MLGLNRVGDYHNGFLVDWEPSPEHFGNIVDWEPSPSYFGNLIRLPLSFACPD